MENPSDYIQFYNLHTKIREDWPNNKNFYPYGHTTLITLAIIIRESKILSSYSLAGTYFLI